MFLVFAGRQHAATGDADKRARVFVLEVVQGGVLAVLAGLGLIDVSVIVIDHAAVDLPGIHRFEHRTVAAVRGEIGFHRLEPVECGGFAFLFEHGGDDRLEVGTAR
ncbi:hypothetical protein D3C80_1512490 [compost metagenome]